MAKKAKNWPLKPREKHASITRGSRAGNGSGYGRRKRKQRRSDRAVAVAARSIRKSERPTKKASHHDRIRKHSGYTSTGRRGRCVAKIWCKARRLLGASHRFGTSAKCSDAERSWSPCRARVKRSV